MTEKDICKTAPDNLRHQVETLARAVYAMQRKIDEQIPIYDKLPIAQTATTTQGEKILKNNPAMQEFRATVRDYAAALKNLADIIDTDAQDTTTKTTNLADFRARYKVG